MEHFINLFNRDLGKAYSSIAPDAMAILQQYDWPGNVHKLQSAMKHALVRNVGEVLTADSLRHLAGAPNARVKGKYG